MDLAFSGEYRDFQNDVRAFLAANLPQDIREKVTRGLRLERDDHQRWQNILSAKGWIAPGWPVEHGGTGWSAGGAISKALAVVQVMVNWPTMVTA